MTGASKILTVSYGTFSCTLEGFDDPFNTMKAIAEYFRDLAAEDRYFGAEPPTPDAAMLHRIAEREIHRRVEAKIQDNGVILRAAEDGEDAPAPVAAAARPALATAPSVSESVAAKLQRIRAKHTPAVPAVAAVAAEDAYSEDEHADDLPAQDLGLVADGSVTAEETRHVAPAEDFLTEAESLLGTDAESALEADTDLSLAASTVDEAVAPATLVATFDDELTDLPDAEDFEAPTLATDTAEDNAPEYAAPEPETVDLEVADLEAADELAMLEGLGADLTADVLPEDESVQTEALDLPELAAPAEDEADMLSRLGDLVIDDTTDVANDFEDDEVEEALYDAPEFDDVPEIATSDDAVLANLGAMINPEGDDDAFDEDLAGEPVAEVMADLADEETIPAQPADAAPLAAEKTAGLPALAEPATIDELSDEPVQDERPIRARARVIRIRRAEPVAPQPAAAPGALSAEAEAALQAELAALEAELGDTAPAGRADATATNAADDDFDDLDLDGFFAEETVTPGAAQPVPAAAQTDDGRKRLNDDSKDDAVNRLIAHANSEMGGEETRRRQSAIAHLKAAVAATVADRKVTGSTSGQDETRLDAYREDLDRVVRPSRPVSGTSTPRPALAAPEPLQRPTPLVLVSEQRIDRPRAAETAVQAPEAGPRRVLPVRPRRIGSGAAVAASVDHAAAPAVTAAMTTVKPNDRDLEDDAATLIDMDDEETDNIFSDGAANFGEFAEQLGATALPDLLEAAAVYCAEVLQRPEFSRPLVMRQVAGLPGNVAANREDCLRGFGTLLRQGRIAKVKRGMFALTDRSPFLAEARKIAG